MIGVSKKDASRLPQTIASLLAIIVLLLGLALVFQADASYQSERAEQAKVRATILAASVTAAVDFGDSRTAQEAVDAFGTDPNARIAAVYGQSGNLLAGYSRAGVQIPTVLRERTRYNSSAIDTVADVKSESERIGWVYLSSDSLTLNRRITRLGLIAAFAVAVSLIVLVLGLGQRTLRQANEKLADAIGELRLEVATREAAESQLRQVQKMEAIGQLTGGIAHDFNNMLAIVLGGIDIADRRIDDVDKARFALANAREGANRAADLTRRLLAFARQQPLQPQVVDTNRLVAKMLELLERTLGGGIIIETELADGLWHVCADPSQLENAVLNLCVNARDAMEGSGTLKIATRNYTSDISTSSDTGQFVTITISDNGPGMTPEVLERAFEPFFTTKDLSKGTGLGLAQVDGFVRQTGGYVKMDSQIGLGVTIEIFLPRYDGPTGLSSDQNFIDGTPLGSKDDVILVVDDEFNVRQMTSESLRDLGYTVVEAGNGAEALEILANRNDITLLFTDVVMPGINGRELAEKAHDMILDLPVLFTTGYTNDSVFQDGMVDRQIVLLSKPFKIEQLAHKVKEALNISHRQISE